MEWTITFHPDLTRERWERFSLEEQFGNIGSEVSRAALAQQKDEQRFERAMFRAFELMDLTIQDPRWVARLKELLRVREFLSDAYEEGREYGTKVQDLQKYFDAFAWYAQKAKGR